MRPMLKHDLYELLIYYSFPEKLIRSIEQDLAWFDERKINEKTHSFLSK